ncbi:MAG: class I SAM-dependent methyltransferase [Bacilli bacterium]|nr:class I SAM-dependent methyltransferase [Bacilli bacterium]MDD4298941.1 class I SAM-dependent methyltransferase [Bacilli bacterium]
MKKEYGFYEKIKDWDFSYIKASKESLTNWDMYKVLSENANSKTVALDLGTGGCENVIKSYPNIKMIVATDISDAMIRTAEENLIKSGRKDITLKVMDNLDMDVPKKYFDIVTARHTTIDAKQIYECLKEEGILIVRGVDKLDCWKLKRMFGKGQGYQDLKPISLIDYENILDAGFREVELVPIHVREYYETIEDLYALLNKTPILDDFSEEHSYFNKEQDRLDENILKKYADENTTDKGILLIRRYYGIVAKK